MCNVEIQEKNMVGDSCQNTYECENSTCLDGQCKVEYKSIEEHGNFLRQIYNQIMAFFISTEECNPGIDAPRPCGNNVGICEFGHQVCLETGYWDQTCVGAINPGIEKNTACSDGLDNDCDGLIDCDDTLNCGSTSYCSSGGGDTGGDKGGSGGLDSDCSPGETAQCGSTTNVGECNIGTKTCRPNGNWGPCGGSQGPVAEIGNLCSDGLDNDCDGLNDTADAASCDGCQGNVITNTCLPSFTQSKCESTLGCYWDFGQCQTSECSNFGSQEEQCIEVPGCEWFGEQTIYCGNNQIDDVLEESCDGGSLNEMNCISYPGQEFTGGQISCYAPGTENECSFNVSQCTITVYSPTQEVYSISGLLPGTNVNIAILTEQEFGVIISEDTTFLSAFNITTSSQPPAGGVGAEISYLINESLVTNPNSVSLYLVNSTGGLDNLDTQLLGQGYVDSFGTSWTNYSSITPHFSIFVALEKQPLCGDGFVDSGEQCDGDNLNGETCGDFGLSGNNLECYPAEDVNECSFNLDGCVDDTISCGDGICDSGESSSNCPVDCPPTNNPGTGPGNSESIDIKIFSPKSGVTYNQNNIPLKVFDKEGNADYWEYVLNGGSRIPFTPNTTISSNNLGSNVIKVYGRTSQTSTYSPYKLVNFFVSSQSGDVCGDTVCGVNEGCDTCSTDCGLCSLIDEEENTVIPEPSKKSNKGIIWFIVIVIALGIFVLVYLIYRKAKGRKSSLGNPSPNNSTSRPPSFSPSMSPNNYQRPVRRIFTSGDFTRNRKP